MLTLAISPDREVSESLEAVITCRVRFKGQSDDIAKDVEVIAAVVDVDDNPPTVSRHEIKQLRETKVGPVSRI